MDAHGLFMIARYTDLLNISWRWPRKRYQIKDQQSTQSFSLAGGEVYSMTRTLTVGAISFIVMANVELAE